MDTGPGSVVDWLLWVTVVFPQLAVNVLRRGEGDVFSVTADIVTDCGDGDGDGDGDLDVAAVICVFETTLLIDVDAETAAPVLMYKFTNTAYPSCGPLATSFLVDLFRFASSVVARIVIL